MKNNITFVISCVVFFALWRVIFASAHAEQRRVTLEEAAQQVAQVANKSFSPGAEPLVASFNARAEGRNVIWTYVMRIKKDLPAATIQEFSRGTSADTAAQVCGYFKVNPEGAVGFKKGIFYTYFYSNTYGEPLASFRVDAKTCGL